MKEQDILRIHYDKETGKIQGLDILLAVVTYLLALDLTGETEKSFIENLKKAVPAYRKRYIESAGMEGQPGTSHGERNP